MIRSKHIVQIILSAWHGKLLIINISVWICVSHPMEYDWDILWRKGDLDD